MRFFLGDGMSVDVAGDRSENKRKLRSNSLRVGVIGFGEAGQIHLRHLQAAGAQVVGIVSRRRKLKAGFPIYESLSLLLPKVDAVTIAVPNHLHAALCLEAIRAGKTVFVEKPLCITAHELAQLERILSSAPVPVKVGFRLRWNPSLRMLRRRLCRVRRISCIYRLGIERLAAGKGWTRRQTESGGSFFTLGVHALDLARWLAGAQGERLSNLQAFAEHQDPSADFPLVVSLSGILPNGISILAGADLRGDAPFELDLSIEAQEGCYPDPSLPAPDPEDEHAEEIEFRGLIADFVEAAQRCEPNPEEILDYLQCHRELIRARELTASGP